MNSPPTTNYCRRCNHRRDDCKPSCQGEDWLCLRSNLPAKERIPAWPDRPQPVDIDHRLIQRLIWDTASPELFGRFPEKLAQAQVQDAYYSRYLSGKTISTLERLVNHRLSIGVYDEAHVQASGFFRKQKGIEGPRWQLNIRPGRVLGIFNLQGHFVGLRANPEVPLRIKQKGQKAKELKYLQAKGVPLHPYIPKSSREKLQQFWANDEPYLLVITEGEDTTEAPTQNLERLSGLPVVFIGLPGVDGWQGTSGLLHPELQRVLARASQLVLAFDSDIMTKKEVRSAMVRLSNAVMSQFEGRLIPLAANWPQVLRTRTKLADQKYGLDDLLGKLVCQGADVQAVFEQLLAPDRALMVKRTWQRKGASWTVESLRSIRVNPKISARPMPFYQLS